MPDDPLLAKVPPHSDEAERAVLGSMMMDPDTLGLCLEYLDADCFFRPEHRIIFDFLKKHFEDNKPLDGVLLEQALRDAGKLEEIGGRDTIVEVYNSVASAANAEYYARIVKDKALLRGLVHAAGEIARDALSSGDPVDNILDRCEQRVFEVTERKIVGQAADVRTILSQVMQTLDFQGGRAITGLETGFYELDDMTRGLQKGEMIVLAARPSVGKSALALNLAEHIAVDLEKPVAFFSIEMSRESLALRLLSSRAKVDGQRLRKGTLTNDEAEHVRDAAARLYEVPLYIDDTPGLRIIDLRAKARRLLARHRIELVIVDYLQLMTTGQREENRQVEVANISRGIKSLARELNIPVLAISQLRRESEERTQPRLSDLRESGAIEQDADVVMLLHREEMRHAQGSKEYEETKGKADLILAKQRNGPVGTIHLTWIWRYTRFEPLSPREMTGPNASGAYGPAGVAAGEEDQEPY
ncbi:MAG: replicative DNA helicase [Phycisphaerae bacterium]|nr:replicative DNA helicase [Phycisphaerae bacterium]